MQGLWNLQTRGIAPGLGYLVWDWIVAASVLCFTFKCLALRPSGHWRSVNLLGAGFCVLLVYLVLHAVDLTIRYKSLTIPYSYILGMSLNDALRTLAEFMVLVGYWKMMERFKTPRVANLLSLSGDPEVRSHWVMPELIPLGILWIIGLYQVGLQLALCVCWLGFIDLGIIDTIARARSAFEVAYAALYFTTLLVMWCFLVFGMPHRNKKEFQAAQGRLPLKHEGLEQVEEAKRSLKGFFEFAVIGGLALVARSCCEIVIVGHLNRWPNNVLEIYRARDGCYGLFSAAFAVMMVSSIPETAEDDPWEIDNLESTREEAESIAEAVDIQTRLQNTLDSWPEEAHDRFKKKLQELTGGGQTAAPDVGQMFSILRDDVRAELKDSMDHRLLQGRLEFLDKMHEVVSHWVPVYRWDGYDPEE